MKIKAGLKFRLEADVEDYEQIEGDTVFARLVGGQAWRFALSRFEEKVTMPHDWQGEKGAPSRLPPSP